MLSYGCTRLEIGVQSVYEDVARDTNRLGKGGEADIHMYMYTYTFMYHHYPVYVYLIFYVHLHTIIHLMWSNCLFVTESVKQFFSKAFIMVHVHLHVHVHGLYLYFSLQNGIHTCICMYTCMTCIYM